MNRGLVLLRHNEVAEEFHRLCAQALIPATVSDEPLVHSGRDLQVRANSEGTNAIPASIQDRPCHYVGEYTSRLDLSR